ncbi:MAG: LysR family transcriptional regulator [Rhodospirillales bacterium]|jgi:DNA-binding transcriptional LysR family regulator
MDSAGEMAVFAEVVEAQNFSVAARALRLTPSAVSKLIGRLEERLGARLLNRTTRQVSLTDEGRTYYQSCLPILAAIKDAEMAVSNFQEEPRGLLKINSSTAFGLSHLEPLLPDLLAKYPDLRIELTLSESIVNLVEEEVDVAIRTGNLPDSSLIARRLGSIRRIVTASPEYLKQHGAPKTPIDLKDHNCLQISTLTTFNHWEFQVGGKIKRIDISGNFETNNATALHRAVLAGIGLMRSANFIVAEDVKAGRLQAVLEEYESKKELGVYAVYPHSQHLSPKVRVFVDMLVDTFVPVQPW